MPKLMGGDEEIYQITGSNFTFQGVRIDRLEATEYTLVTIAVDETGSVVSFATELREMLVTAVEGCRKSPRPENLLVRVITFSTRYRNGVNEIHGFKPLSEIDTKDYPALNPGGMTPLCDVSYSCIEATNTYGKALVADFGVNAIAFIITDGGDNQSTITKKMVKEEALKSITGEILESMVTILIGINIDYYLKELESFKKEAGINEFIDAKEVTKGRLAKLAGFVSQSVSSQSQALGTGGPSQNIAATI